jgi:hypothetical protein
MHGLQLLTAVFATAVISRLYRVSPRLKSIVAAASVSGIQALMCHLFFQL